MEPGGWSSGDWGNGSAPGRHWTLDLVERLCDRVGIISAGRMVAVGTVEELRSGGVERIDVVGPRGADWASGLQRLGLAIVTSVLLFMSLIGYGTAVAQGVVEEKSSRVVELLLATIRPIHLLTGKVLGLGAVGLAQLVTLGAVGLAGATASGLLTAPSAAASALVAAAIWYLLGFFLYASVYAAAGSMVSRQEELQSLVTPIMFPLFLPFLFAVSVLPGDPRNTVGTVLSFVQFFAPTLMPARAALGVAPWWQVGIAVVLTLATIVGVV